MVMKSSFTLIFLFLSILAGLAKSERWKHNDQSQVAENASPGLSSFLEHVLKAQDEINWVKKVFQHEKEATKEQCLQCNPFPSSENFQILDSDSEYHLDTPVQNEEENEWGLGSRGKNFASDFMYDSSQNRLKYKNTGERFKRRSADQLYKDPELKEIVKNNVNNLHMLKFAPEQDTDIHIIAETSDINSEDGTSIERRGTGQTDSSEESSLEFVAQKGDPSDSVAEAYFAAHGKRQASRRQSISTAHSRGVHVDVPDPLNEADLMKTMSERSEQEHQRLQLEDADGLLKGTRVDSHIGSIDNQMILDEEKTIKQTNKAKFQTVPIQESKITSRDSQSQDSNLPQQIKLDLLNDPLYNKVDLKTASQNVNIRSDKSEKSLIAPLSAGSSSLDNRLLSSVHQYLAGFDQQRQESPNREDPELDRAQIFLNKKDTSSQQVKLDESAVTPQPLRPAQVIPYQNLAERDSDSSVLLNADSNLASKDMTLLRLRRTNHEIFGDLSRPASEDATNEIRNQFMAADQRLHQSSRDKRTVVKRPGAIWRETAGNQDLEEEPETENEGKGVISFDSEESDVDGNFFRNSNVDLSKPTSDDNYSSASEAEETIEDNSDNRDLDDAARLKASFKFSSKYAPNQDINNIQKADGKVSELHDNHLLRNERSIKKPRQEVETGNLSQQKEKEGPVGKTSNGGSYHERKTESNNLDDASRLKASYKFSSKFVPPLDANRVEESDDFHVAFDSNISHPMRNGREIKKSVRRTETFAGGSDRNKHEGKSHELKPVITSDDVFEESKNSNMLREQRDNPSQMGKSHSSRSLLFFFEPTNIEHNLGNERGLPPPARKLNRSIKEQKEEGKYLAEPLSTIIDRELLSGNLPPLVRVKRSATDAEFVGTHDNNFNKLASETVNEKQSVVDENPVKQNADDWESSCLSEKLSMFDQELNKQRASIQDSVHGNAKQSAIMPSTNNMEILNVNVNRAIDDVQLDKQGSYNQKSVLENTKRSVDDSYLDEEVAGDVDQEAIFENQWSSGLARTKRAHVHAKRNHGKGKGPTARDAGGKEAASGKGAEKLSRDTKSEWKINIRSTKHTRRSNEDEDEKEYESSDLNMFAGNVTKRASGQADSKEFNFGEEEGSEMGVISINLPLKGLVDETEDENEYESSQVEKDKDYDVVRRHVRHSFNKRHPANKDFEQVSISNIGSQGTNGETKIKDYSIKDVVKYKEREEEKESRPNEILSEDRFKRASNYDNADTGKVMSDLMSMPGLSNNDVGNTKLIRNSKSVFKSDLKSPYENANKLDNHPVNSNPAVMPVSKMTDLRSPISKNGNIKLPSSNKDKATPGFALPGSDFHEIHEMRLAGTKLSDSPTYGFDPKTSVPYSKGNYEDMKLQVPIANEQAPEMHVRCAEKCTSSPTCLDANRVSTTSPSCSTKCLGPGSQLRAERGVDHRRGIVNTPKPGQSEESAASEYKGELDDGQLGTEIVQAIFQQVDKTPCLKKSFASGLSLRYHPSEIKETKEFNSRSQQMMHQIMQLIDQSVDEEVKSRTCSSLPSDLEEFITWLMNNETHPVSSTENPFLFESHCGKPPAPRHLEELKPEDIKQQISLRNNLVGEYNKLDKCDQDVVKPIYNYLTEQKTFLTTLLEKPKSKSGCKKSTESKKPDCDSDLEQQRLVEETMDSVGLGPNAMHSSNIGDKFISGMSMVDESAEGPSDADGTSVARRSVPEDGQMVSQKILYERSHFPDSRSEDVYALRVQRDTEDDLPLKRYPQNLRHHPKDIGIDDVFSDDDYGAADYDDNEADDDGEVADNRDLKRSLEYSSRCKENRNKQRSIRKSYFFPSQKYKRLVALASELKRKKRNVLRRKQPHA